MRIGLSLKLSEPKYNVLAQNIRALFADGSQGWWYDDNDTTTLFQDSAGTTPVTAVEQFVGLQLDKSRGLVLGSALITPEAGPYVSAPTGVSAAGSGVLSVVSGAVRETAPGGTASRLEIAFAATAAKTYRVSILVNSNFGFVPVAFVNTVDANPFGASPFYASGSTTLTFYVSAVATSNIILRFYPRSSSVPNQISGDYVEFSSISVRELPGNHRYAPASGNRPIWSKRVNLLTKTEQFDDAAWNAIVGGLGSTPTRTGNFALAPNGTMTATRLQFSLGGGTTTSDSAYITQSVTMSSSSVIEVWLKSNTASNYDVYLRTQNTGVTVTVTPSWQKFSLTGALAAGVLHGFGLRGGQTPANSNTADILAWGADLRPANQATGLLPLYQRVNTSSDYDTNGFPGYFKADGTDDFLQTNSINFTATDKVTLCAGVRKLSDAARGVVTELGPGTSAGFSLFAPNLTTVTFAFRSFGSAAGATAETSTTFAAPITGVLTGIGEIGTDTSILRVNAVQQATSATDQGTGNYPNNLVYFFRRSGLSSPFNGNEYGNIAVGKLLTADQLTALETYMNGLTKAY